jgi:hypothetical protein
LRARGALALDFSWRGGQLATLAISGKPGTPVRLRYRGKADDVVLDAQGKYRRTY